MTERYNVLVSKMLSGKLVILDGGTSTKSCGQGDKVHDDNHKAKRESLTGWFFKPLSLAVVDER